MGDDRPTAADNASVAAYRAQDQAKALSERLEEAMQTIADTTRRIRELEQEVAVLKGPNPPPANDGWCHCSAHESLHIHTVHVPTASPLPDEGT